MTAALVARANAEAARADLEASDWIALDTEFHAENRYVPRLLLVQVHTPSGHTWLLDPLDTGPYVEVAPALAQVPRWIVHAGTQDLRLLSRSLGRVPERVDDTQIAAGLVSDRHPSSLADLMAAWLDVTLDKGAQMTDWTTRPLSQNQLAYAAADVARLPRLWDALAAAAEALDRTELVGLACREARDRAIGPPDPDWRRVARGVRLTAPQAATLVQLVAWREEEAAASDRPTFFVLGDAMLRQLARLRPRSLGALEAHRRLSPKVIRRHGQAILDAVAPDDAPDPGHVQPGTATARRLAWLDLWAGALGHARTWAARLVLPDRLLHELVTDPPQHRSDLPRRLGPWRDALVGEALHDALHGGAQLLLGTCDVRVELPGSNRGKAEGD